MLSCSSPRSSPRTQIPDDQAAVFAASILAKNNGAIGSTIQQLLHTAISRSSISGPTLDPRAVNPPQAVQKPWQTMGGLGGPQAAAMDLDIQRMGALQMLQGQIQQQNSGLAAALMGMTGGAGLMGGANGVSPRNWQGSVRSQGGIQHQHSGLAALLAGNATGGGSFLQLGQQNGAPFGALSGLHALMQQPH